MRCCNSDALDISEVNPKHMEILQENTYDTEAIVF